MLHLKHYKSNMNIFITVHAWMEMQSTSKLHTVASNQQNVIW